MKVRTTSVILIVNVIGIVLAGRVMPPPVTTIAMPVTQEK